MDLVKSYIVDESGDVESVVLDYKVYKKIESLFLDQGLAKAMEEVETDEEIDMSDAKKILNFNNGN